MDTDGDAWLIIPELIDCGFTGCAPCEVNSHMDAGKLRALGKPNCVLFDVKNVFPKDEVDARL